MYSPMNVSLVGVESDQNIDHSVAVSDRDCTMPRSLAEVTIAGPLCFSGDIIAGAKYPLKMPTPRAGDRVVVLDAGANTLSLFSRHCSRPSPAVYAYRRIPKSADNPYTETSAGQGEGGPGFDGVTCHIPGDNDFKFVITCIRREESYADLLSFWG